MNVLVSTYIGGVVGLGHGIAINFNNFTLGMTPWGDDVSQLVEDQDYQDADNLSKIGTSALGAAGALKLLARAGLSFVGTVPLTQLTAQVSLEYHLLTASSAVAASDQRIREAASAAQRWLGAGYSVAQNRSGDYIFMSADRLRKIRFDYLNSHGDIPHMHLEAFTNGRWRDAIAELHRLYPK